MEKQLLLLSDVATLLRLRPHQIVYALTSHAVEDVAVRIGGRRMFQSSDVKRLARHFGVAPEKEAAHG